MLRATRIVTAGTLLTGGLLMAAGGCGRGSDGPSVAAQAAPTAPQPAPTTTADDENHAHKPGAYGGNIVSIGSDNYHAEAVFESGGVLRLYLLGRDESQVQETAWQTLTGYAKLSGETESTAFKLEPKPQPDDAHGKTSVFVGQLPERLARGPVEVTIPSVRIGDERFRVAFSSAPAPAHVEDMPDSLADEEARKLFLTPGGAYTEADIAANGRQTAAQKFRSFVPLHDLFPKPGDKICPITLTKANPKCTWTVGGKTYEFCCPPCVEEFVKLAKNDPDKLHAPDEYVKRVEADDTKRR